MPGFPAVLLWTLRDLRTEGVSAAAFCEVAASTLDPTGKLAGPAALFE